MNKWIDRIMGNEIVGAEIRHGEFKLSVHHYFGRGDAWFASCNYLFDKVELASKELNDAKVQAEAMLQVVLEEAIKSMYHKFEQADIEYKKNNMTTRGNRRG